ncbi:MAG: DUF2961 domain-containing protein [Mucilaginibacter polytrichastri]|nr:DUF2961 domain-containing protein [Mucilaginibacter polytrichastri]
MKRIVLHFALLLTGAAAFAQEKVTLGTLLDELADPASVARLPDPDFQLMQVSSYDRHSVAPGQSGWFANDDHTHFIRDENHDGRTERVMMDEEGPGAIVRFWETSFKRHGNLRIYFDGHTKPDILIPAYDLMKFPFDPGKALLAPHSSYEPEQKGGSTLYLPLPYSRHCKVTWEDLDTATKEPRYYQINFRRYPPGTVVQTFSGHVFAENSERISRVNRALLNPGTGGPGASLSTEKVVAPEEDMTLNVSMPGSAVSSFSIRLHDPGQYTDAILRNLFLRIAFDGTETVYCPLSDFFGSGAGNGAVLSWYRTVVPRGEMSARFVMPFRRSAKFSVLNGNGEPVAMAIRVFAEKRPWDKQRSLYFHADWRQEKKVPIRRTEEDRPIEWTISRYTGRGIFVGETFSINNHMHKWYGEGDQKLWVDDDRFPSEYGTGLEDYYNTSWAPVVLYQTPFANATRADYEDSYGENTFTRTRNLDIVPFRKRFHFTVEMLGWENGTGDVSTTSYWYGRPGAKNTQRGSRSEK